jgi:L-ribulose-5-phosphate 4-epimerase
VPYAPDASVAPGIAAALDAHPSRAVLLERHGVYAVGERPRDAVRGAVLLEDAARIVQLARASGADIRPLDAHDVDAIRARRLRADAARLIAQRDAESAAAGSYPTSRPGAARRGGGTGSRTTPVSNGSTPDNDVRTRTQ